MVFGLCLWFLLFSPPSGCFSLPSTMTWAPCPHGVRTRGKKTGPTRQCRRNRTAFSRTSRFGDTALYSRVQTMLSRSAMMSAKYAHTTCKGACRPFWSPLCCISPRKYTPMILTIARLAAVQTGRGAGKHWCHLQREPDMAGLLQLGEFGDRRWMF